MDDKFISYSSKDRKRVAKRVASFVESLTGLRGWSNWWDEQVKTGDRFTS
jgi:hypothetical protein